MRRFLNRLLRDFRTTSTARGGRQAPHRAALQVEGLEDRLVMTAGLRQFGSTLLINVSQNQQITLESTGFSNGFRGLEVFDNGTLVDNPADFSIDSNVAVSITLAGGDSVYVNDSNGMPFAQNTAISLIGSGSNTVTLGGSRGIAGNETYVAGAAGNSGSVSVDNLKFYLVGITSVTDLFQITGVLDVQTSGTNVVLSGSNGSTQTLSGMGVGGGDTLTYANKPGVTLETYSANAVVSLNATAAATLERSFSVLMHEAGDSTVIATTPSNVTTVVQTVVAPVANPASVYLRANAGPVLVDGNSSTFLSVGQPLSNGEMSTKGIQCAVAVYGVGDLFLSDSGNVSTPENVTVTQSAIYGSGLFGNNGELSYYNVGTLNLVTGQDGADYTVAGSSQGATFTSKINITFFSTTLANVPIRADVFVSSGSHLNLQLFNETKQDAELDIHSDGIAGLPGTLNGTVDVTFPGVPNSQSQISYYGFDLVYQQG